MTSTTSNRRFTPRTPAHDSPPVPLPRAPAPVDPVAPPDEITALDALELSRRIADRELSCVEVMTAYLARIDAINPGYNAIVARVPDESLLAQARQRDEELATGRNRGWLHGIPQAPKDLAATAGIVTSRGSRLFARDVPENDSLIVARARDEGAILIGKTNVPEFGLGSQTFNDVYGATRNAHNPALTAGGSSGGAAVALALNLLPVADGSDMMGSLRNPAAFNGVYGFRPSFGRVPQINVPDQFIQQLGVEGPMGRTPQDCARLLATQAGHDFRAPLSLPGNGSEFIAVSALTAKDLNDSPLAGSRIGWLGDLEGYLPFEPGVLALTESTLREFEALGARVDPCDLGFPPEALWSSWLALRQCLQGGNLLPLARDPASRRQMKPEAQWEASQAQRGSMADLFQASATRTAFYQAMFRIFAQFDFIALPTAQVFPFDIGQRWPAEIAGRPLDTYHRWMEVVLPATMAGLPVMSIPVPLEPTSGPPTRLAGLQLIGPPRGDASVLRTSAIVDLARG